MEEGGVGAVVSCWDQTQSRDSPPALACRERLDIIKLQPIPARRHVPSRSRGNRDTSALLLLRAIQLDIAGMASAASLPTARARQGSIHTVSRRRSGNIRELCAALLICHLDGVISTWADFQEQKYAR